MTEAAGQSRGSEWQPRVGLPVGIGLGASAGGPRALLTLLAGLELPRSALAFLVQHIHPRFTSVLSRRLNEAAAVPVVAAEDGATALPGRLYMAPSGQHLVVERSWPCLYRMRLTDQPPRHGVRPSVDELFISLAAGTVELTVPAGFTASETFDVGIDVNSPVADDYFDKAPFAFNGKLKRLHFKYLRSGS